MSRHWIRFWEQKSATYVLLNRTFTSSAADVKLVALSEIKSRGVDLWFENWRRASIKLDADKYSTSSKRTLEALWKDDERLNGPEPWQIKTGFLPILVNGKNSGADQ